MPAKPNALDTLSKPFVEFAKKIAFRHLKLGGPRYLYSVEPIQLCTLVMELERLKDVTGNVVEIGVARGMTTRFLCQHIVNQGMDKSLTYYAVDTFDSFTQADLEYEVAHRGKSMFDLRAFEYNDVEVWKSHFAAFPFVKAIQSDCSAVDYARLAPIKVSLLDVDLYLPTQKTLPKLFDATVSGGVIVLDDIRNDNTYDGAYQAYMEFCAERKIEPKVVGNKCGLIYKP